MGKKAIIYTRVLTDDQKANYNSLSEQELMLRKYCSEENIEIVAHYQDDFSAEDFNRPEFKKMESDIQNNSLKADLFLCVRMDRYSRNAHEALNKILELKKNGIEFRTMELNYDLLVPENLIPFIINIANSEIENEIRNKKLVLHN